MTSIDIVRLFVPAIYRRSLNIASDLTIVADWIDGLIDDYELTLTEFRMLVNQFDSSVSNN